MADVENPEPYAPGRTLPGEEQGFHQYFGKPDASTGFIFLDDYLFSITYPPQLTTQNLPRTFKPNPASQARFQQQFGTDVLGTYQLFRLFSSLADKIPDSGGVGFDYINDRPITSIHEILSVDTLDRHTDQLLDFLGRDIKTPKHIILVGHGYGGLLCEQVFMRLRPDSTSSTTARAKQRLRGILLVNTPHFRAGLAEWTMLTARKLRINAAKNRQEQNWSKCKTDFTIVSRMQAEFADIFERAESGVRIACCFAKLPDPVDKLRLSPEFCCLPHVEAIEIHDSSHFRINTTENDRNYIIERLATWVKEMKEKKPVLDPLPLGSLAGSSRSNDPAWKWDPKSTDYYFILSWKGKSTVSAASVTLGDIMKEKIVPSSTNQPIATRDEVVSAQNEHLVDFSLSQILKNDLDKWKNLLNRDIETAGYEFVVREEWTNDRSIEYMKAALQLKAVRESLKGETRTVYVVTGVLRGAKAADSDENERSDVLGYRCQKVSVMQPSGKQMDGMKLNVEPVKARPWSESRADKFKPTVEVKPLPDIEAESSGGPQLEAEQEGKRPGDAPPEAKPSKGLISKAVKSIGNMAESAVKAISNMGRTKRDNESTPTHSVRKRAGNSGIVHMSGATGDRGSMPTFVTA